MCAFVEWFYKYEVHHNFNEGNKCVDFLAKMGVSLEESLIVLHQRPVEPRNVLLDDAFGVVFLIV